MSADIILDDWALPVAIDDQRNNSKVNEVDREKLERNIQKNREVIHRIRCEKKYKNILQEV